MPITETKNPAQTFKAAMALHAQGRLPEAERLYNAVLKASPNHFDTLYRLGLVHLQQGRCDNAIRLIRKALNQRPQSAEAQLNLGNAFRAVNRLEEALERYQRALEIKPDFAEAHNNIGSILALRLRFEEAIPHYERAIAVKPGYAEAYNNLGTAYVALGRIEDARARYEKAIAANPAFVDAYGNLANTLKELGRIAEASGILERAIARAPRRTQYYHGLADCRRFGADDPKLVALEALAREASALAVEERVHLHFALGKIYDGLDRKEPSFLQLLEANRLRRGTTAYDEAATLGEIETIKSVFTPDFITARQGGGASSTVPVFILGMPRSGTSLVEQILASHAKVFGAGEPSILQDAVATVAKTSGNASLPRAALSSLDAADFQRLGTAYLDQIRKLSPEALRIVDKTPENFRFIGLIHLALPKARIIHTQRDPIDTCLSCFSQLFLPGALPFTYDLAELGRYYRAYEGLMAHWRRVLPTGTMLEVQYEAVVADLEGQARRILDFCGLAWDPACLEFYKTERPVRTASAIQVRQPIYSSSIGRWRPYAHHLTPLFAALGRTPPP